MPNNILSYLDFTIIRIQCCELKLKKSRIAFQFYFDFFDKTNSSIRFLDLEFFCCCLFWGRKCWNSMLNEVVHVLFSSGMNVTTPLFNIYFIL